MGRQTRRCFALGDPIRIKVASANLYRKALEYELVGQLASEDKTHAAFYSAFVHSEKQRGKGGKDSSKSPKKGGKKANKNRKKGANKPKGKK